MEETKQFLSPPPQPPQCKLKLLAITNGRETITIQGLKVYNFKFKG
jgi:hypothetical protein